jgi:hypothetical protein
MCPCFAPDDAQRMKSGQVAFSLLITMTTTTTNDGSDSDGIVAFACIDFACIGFDADETGGLSAEPKVTFKRSSAIF